MARFFRRGVTRIYYLPSVATPTAPSSGEVTAGTELTASIAGITGFQLQNNPIATPDFQTTFNSSIPGEDSTNQSELTFYAQDGSDTIKTTLSKGTAGFILFAMRGSTAANPAEVWPVTVAFNTEEYTLGNDPARYMVGFTVTSRPTQNATMP